MWQSALFYNLYFWRWIIDWLALFLFVLLKNLLMRSKIRQIFMKPLDVAAGSAQMPCLLCKGSSLHRSRRQQATWGSLQVLQERCQLRLSGRLCTFAVVRCFVLDIFDGFFFCFLVGIEGHFIRCFIIKKSLFLLRRKASFYKC